MTTAKFVPSAGPALPAGPSDVGEAVEKFILDDAAGGGMGIPDTGVFTPLTLVAPVPPVTYHAGGGALALGPVGGQGVVVRENGVYQVVVNGSLSVVPAGAAVRVQASINGNPADPTAEPLSGTMGENSSNVVQVQLVAGDVVGAGMSQTGGGGAASTGPSAIVTVTGPIV